MIFGSIFFIWDTWTGGTPNIDVAKDIITSSVGKFSHTWIDIDSEFPWYMIQSAYEYKPYSWSWISQQLPYASTAWQRATASPRAWTGCCMYRWRWDALLTLRTNSLLESSGVCSDCPVPKCMEASLRIQRVAWTRRRNQHHNSFDECDRTIKHHANRSRHMQPQPQRQACFAL